MKTSLMDKAKIWDISPEEIDKSRKVNKKLLINILNYLNFKDEQLLVCLRLKDSFRILEGYPEPCFNNSIHIKWVNRDSSFDLDNWKPSHLLAEFKGSLIYIPVSEPSFDDNGFILRLKEDAYDISKRENRRFKVEDGIEAELDQSGVMERGRLIDFNAYGFRIELPSSSYKFFKWLNPDQPLMVKFISNSVIVFSEPCKLIRLEERDASREIVVKPLKDSINRFPKKEIRNPRRSFRPYPLVIFKHPLIGRLIKLEVFDISTTGFSVYENRDEPILVPGLIIPELKIRFSGNMEFTCMAQVIYRIREKEGKRCFRCGLSILDMDHNSFSAMAELLLRISYPQIYISNEVDVEELWRFFFESGFIYPKKYKMIYGRKDRYRQVYEKLYRKDSEISKHFTIESKGRIIAHISLIRAYSRAWMIHHHASIARYGKRAGLTILRQIMEYLNDLFRIPNINMDYIFSFFRPENRFPNRIFGDFARSTKNKKLCSMDLFAYVYVNSAMGSPDIPLKSWTIDECKKEDIKELKIFYTKISNGLMIDIFDFDVNEQRSIEVLYERLGLYRKSKNLVLKYNNLLKAFIIIDQSSNYLNLSGLLNTVKVIIIDPEDFSFPILLFLLNKYTNYNIPDRFLIYPDNYLKLVDKNLIQKYYLWIYNTKLIDEFIKIYNGKYIKFNKSEGN